MRTKNKELQQLLAIIKAKTKMGQEEISQQMGYSRTHVSLALNEHVNPEPVIINLKAHYADILGDKGQLPKMDTDKLIKENLAYSKVILGAVAELLAKESQLPVATELDKLNRAIAEELKHLS